MQDSPHRIALIVSWMTRLLVRCVAERRLLVPETALPVLQNACLEIRRVIAECSVLVESQLPFPCARAPPTHTATAPVKPG